MAEFVLRVPNLEKGVSTHSFEISGEWLRAQLADLEGIDASGEVGRFSLTTTIRGQEVLLSGEVRATLLVDCVRCLETFEFPIEGDLAVLMVPGPAPVAGEDEEDGEDLGVEHYQGEEIELDELIRDTIVLEVPISPSCGDSCPGWEHLKDGPTEVEAEQNRFR